MKNTARGFALMDVMIASAISTIVIFGAFTMLQVSNNQLNIIHAKMSLQESPREGLFKMAQEIRQTSAHQITDFGNGNALSGNEINFRVPVPSPDETTLVDNSFAPLWAADINYSLNTATHQIIRTSLEDGVTKEAVLANNVTALSFARPTAVSPLVTIQINVQMTLSDGRTVPNEPMVLTTQAEARNP